MRKALREQPPDERNKNEYSQLWLRLAGGGSTAVTVHGEHFVLPEHVKPFQ
jgi:hypothetical protein